MISCVRSFSIDCGHRVYGHESKCANLHGHTYRIDVHAVAEDLDGLGRVIDFSVLKARIGEWLDEYWDHGFIVALADEAAGAAIRALSSKLYVMPYNPTAENMAQYLLTVVCPSVLRGTNVLVAKVVVQETPNCRAEATLL